MDLHAVIVSNLDDPSQSSSTVNGQIRDFEINLFGSDGPTYFLHIPFDSLTFTAKNGQKTDVQVQISSDGITFEGALQFVQDLATYLSFDGSGLVIDTAGSAITATLTLAIPTIAVGVFSLQNIAFSAACVFPYNGDPVNFQFGFCSADNPFQLSIMIFEGGGYVTLALGVDGLERLEFGFDFGLGIAINIGVASGQVSLTGGVSYSMQKLSGGKQEVDLTAYVKASGGISALGIVSVSVELYLGLTYQGPPSVLIGEAEMSISVHILFFGGTVTVDVQEQFAGTSGGTSAAVTQARKSRKALAAVHPDDETGSNFGDTMTTLADWDSYCTSFALVGTGS